MRHPVLLLADVYKRQVNGRSMLAHTAYREAEVAVNNMLGKRDVMRYNAIPGVLYTCLLYTYRCV